MKIQKFEDIEAWKKSRDLVNTIYQLTNNEGFSKDWWLKDQIRRAWVSVLSNIAEWFERQSDSEFKKFLYYAKWSVGEVRTQLYIAYDQNYISKEELETNIQSCLEIARMISKFITYLHGTR